MAPVWSTQEIKKLINESKISFRLKRYAIEQNRSLASVSAKFYKIRTKNGLSWTQKDVNKLMNLKTNGYSNSYIAKTLKRSVSAIYAKYNSQKTKNKVIKHMVKQENNVLNRLILDNLLIPVKIEESI